MISHRKRGHNDNVVKIINFSRMRFLNFEFWGFGGGMRSNDRMSFWLVTSIRHVRNIHRLLFARLVRLLQNDTGKSAQIPCTTFFGSVSIGQLWYISSIAAVRDNPVD